jgi:5'-AMP-activated protein kinase regulatory beta subunit
VLTTYTPTQGNTATKRSSIAEDPSELDGFHVGSPPTSPGSPLTYSPQVAMEPLTRQEDVMGQRHATEFVGAAGWPAQPKLVPVVITCKAPCAAG